MLITDATVAWVMRVTGCSEQDARLALAAHADVRESERLDRVIAALFGMRAAEAQKRRSDAARARRAQDRRLAEPADWVRDLVQQVVAEVLQRLCEDDGRIIQQHRAARECEDRSVAMVQEQTGRDPLSARGVLEEYGWDVASAVAYLRGEVVVPAVAKAAAGEGCLPEGSVPDADLLPCRTQVAMEVLDVMQAAHCTQARALQLLKEAGGNVIRAGGLGLGLWSPRPDGSEPVPDAVGRVMDATDCTREEAVSALAAHEWFPSAAIASILSARGRASAQDGPAAADWGLGG